MAMASEAQEGALSSGSKSVAETANVEEEAEAFDIGASLRISGRSISHWRSQA